MTDLFDRTIILGTERVLLRPLERSDLDAYIRFSETEPETWKFSLVSPVGKEQMTTYVEQALLDRERKTAYPFTVIDKASGNIIGSTRFYDVNLAFGYTQLGYTWYGEQYRGTGLNRHAKFLLLRFAFEDLQLERVEFRADATNARSIAAMKKIGCTVEGILRSHMPNLNGGRRDSIVLSILKSEWDNGLLSIDSEH